MRAVFLLTAVVACDSFGADSPPAPPPTVEVPQVSVSPTPPTPRDAGAPDAHVDAPLPLRGLFDISDPALAGDLEAVLADTTVADNAAAALHKLARFHNDVTYDSADLNGYVSIGAVTPTSALHRFREFLHEAWGVKFCNKDGAKLHLKNVPNIPLVSFRACDLLEIDNLGRYYLDAIVGEVRLAFGPAILADATTVGILEGSSGIRGFWESNDGAHPKPEWLNRVLFFDVAHDGVEDGQPNHLTNEFLSDLRNPSTSAGSGVFAAEATNFYAGIAPVLRAYVKQGREDLFLTLLDTADTRYGE